MIADGKISKVGTYRELVDQGVDFKVEIEEKSKKKLEEEKKKKEAEDLAKKQKEAEDMKKSPKRNRRKGRGSRGRGAGRGRGHGRGRGGRNDLIEEEDEGKGNVNFSRYKYYFTSMGTNAVKFWICLLIVRRGMEIVTPFILAEWSAWSVETCQKQVYRIECKKNSTYQYSFEDCKLEDEDNQYYINIYVLCGMIAVFFVTFQAVVLAVLRVRASTILHNNMLARIMRAPTKFFDTTPLGRILNRFSTDVSAVDNQLAASLSQLMSASFNILGAYVAISISTIGTAIIALFPITWMYHKISKYFRMSSTQMKRIESNSRSPIFSSFSETLNGLSSIRAYGMTEAFTKENDARFTVNGRNRLTAQFLNGWLGIRLDAMSSILSFLVAAYSTATYGTELAIPPGWAALALTLSFETTNFLKHGIRVYAQTEAAMVSVERIAKYTDEVEQESETVDDAERLVELENWPMHGKVEVKNLSMRYRKNLPLVLDDISFTVEAGHRIGIVGRTGAGKSSIMNAFFRMVEAEQGSVCIDGVDTHSISLDTLRSRMTIIPQDPVMFSTTVRANLDPFTVYTDEEIWDALDRCRMKPVVEGLKLKLQSPVSEGGANFSVGQRQLICIARALLRKPKILLLDEATASIDSESDEHIQQTIREAFGKITIITIAHRINTIIDSDKILVMNDGKISEYDTPKNLLSNKDSEFSSLVDDMGESAAEKMRQQAGL